jgi:hypothetical protein
MNNQKEEIYWKAPWTGHKWGKDSANETVQLLQNGGDLQHVISMSEVTPKTGTTESKMATHTWR